MDSIGLDPWVDGLDWVSKNGPMPNSDAALAQVRRSLIDVIDSKQQCKRFVIEDSFIVLARAYLG